MVPTLTGAAAAALYLLGVFWHWRRLKQTNSALPGASSALPGAPTAPGVTSSNAAATAFTGPLLVLGAAAVLLHGISTASLLNQPGGVDFNIMAMAVGVAWVVAIFTLLASLRLPVSNLLLLIFPLSAATLLAAVVTGRFDPDAVGTTQGVVLSTALLSHIVISIAAYSILSMAALQSVLLAAQEHQLKQRQTRGLVRLLPPMETMERLLFILLSVGLATLTIAIASGFAFLDDMFAQNISHHTILACLAWVVFAVLLYGNKVLGWRGYTAVRWTLAGFVLLLLGYFGSKFVTEVLLGS